MPYTWRSTTDYLTVCHTQIPTFVLGLGSIVSRLRSDVIFGLCFFTTRIVYHIVLAVSLAVQHDAIGGSFGPAIIMAGIFPLHAFWFVGCIKGFLKRAKTVEKSVPVTRLPINTISSPGTPLLHPFPDSVVTVVLIERLIMPGAPGPVSSYASRASLARRRTALRMAVRARWDQLKLWKASGRLSEMQRRVRDALPGRERVYQYVGLERHPYSVSLLPSVQGLEYIGEDASLSPVS